MRDLSIMFAFLWDQSIIVAARVVTHCAFMNSIQLILIKKYSMFCCQNHDPKKCLLGYVFQILKIEFHQI